MATTSKLKRPATGKLVWIENSTLKEVEIQRGPWALLQSLKVKLSIDVNYAGGKLKLKYL